MNTVKCSFFKGKGKMTVSPRKLSLISEGSGVEEFVVCVVKINHCDNIMELGDPVSNPTLW